MSTERRRRRQEPAVAVRKPAADVRDVFDQMKVRMAIKHDRGDADVTDGDNNSLWRSESEEEPALVIGPAIAAEIASSLHWAEAFVEGFTYVDSCPVPPGDIDAKRKRLRQALNVLNSFMGCHPELQKLGFRDDIATLGIALDSLNSSVVHPLLITKKIRKPGDTKLDQLFRGYVVSFVTILLSSGYPRKEAFKEVAKRLTAARFKAPRISDYDPSFKVETVRRYFQRAQPAAEDMAAHKNTLRDNKKALGQRDSQVVANLLDSFVMNAVHIDKERLPPSKTYAEQVIKATLRHPSFQSLFANKMRCA